MLDYQYLGNLKDYVYEDTNTEIAEDKLVSLKQAQSQKKRRDKEWYLLSQNPWHWPFHSCSDSNGIN
jgi:hypothetical protein